MAVARAPRLGLPWTRRRVRPVVTWPVALLLIGVCVFLTIGSLMSAPFAEQTVAGLAQGGVYASLAVALVLIYRATEVINFAQGEMAMFTTYIAYQLMQWGVSYWAAFFATIAIGFAGGIAVERVVIRPIARGGVLTVVVATIGLLILLQGAASWIWTPQLKVVRSSFSARPIRVGSVAFTVQDLGTIGVTIGAVVLLWLFFQFTKTGLAMRAAALRPAAARLVGVRVGWMLALGWGLAAALGAVTGLMVVPTTYLQPTMMDTILIYAFAAAVVGGIENPAGAVVGGLGLGVLLNLLGAYAGFLKHAPELDLPVALAVLLVVLLIRPAGLFGRTLVRRV